MILQAYSIKDDKVGFYAPTYEQNDKLAIRVFQSIYKDKNSTISSYPADFSLFAVGSFDTDTGLLTSQTPKFLVSAASFDFIEQHKECENNV